MVQWAPVRAFAWMAWAAVPVKPARRTVGRLGGVLFRLLGGRAPCSALTVPQVDSGGPLVRQAAGWGSGRRDLNLQRQLQRGPVFG
jgi:hypothetical protein